MTLTTEMTGVDMLRRMAEATGSPHYGGILPDDAVANAGFSLPGGGMVCHWDGLQKLDITVCSLGGVVRLSARLVRGELDQPSMLTAPYNLCGYDRDFNPTPDYWSRGSRANIGSVRPTYFGLHPRARDIERLRGWIAVARGESEHIPQHGRPPEAEDSPLDLAIGIYRDYPHSVSGREIAHACGLDGPRVGELCRSICLGRVTVRSDGHKWEMLTDAAIADRADAGEDGE